MRKLLLFHFASFSAQGSFTEVSGFLVHCINMAIMLTLPAAVVLSVPSVTPGNIFFTVNVPSLQPCHDQLYRLVACVMQPNHYPPVDSRHCCHVHKTDR